MVPLAQGPRQGRRGSKRIQAPGGGAGGMEVVSAHGRARSRREAESAQVVERARNTRAADEQGRQETGSTKDEKRTGEEIERAKEGNQGESTTGPSWRRPKPDLVSRQHSR